VRDGTAPDSSPQGPGRESLDQALSLFRPPRRLAGAEAATRTVLSSAVTILPGGRGSSCPGRGSGPPRADGLCGPALDHRFRRRRCPGLAVAEHRGVPGDTSFRKPVGGACSAGELSWLRNIGACLATRCSADRVLVPSFVAACGSRGISRRAQRPFVPQAAGDCLHASRGAANAEHRVVLRASMLRRCAEPAAPDPTRPGGGGSGQRCQGAMTGSSRPSTAGTGRPSTTT
jgi:hypothetical protein